MNTATAERDNAEVIETELTHNEIVREVFDGCNMGNTALFCDLIEGARDRGLSDDEIRQVLSVNELERIYGSEDDEHLICRRSPTGHLYVETETWRDNTGTLVSANEAFAELTTNSNVTNGSEPSGDILARFKDGSARRNRMTGSNTRRDMPAEAVAVYDLIMQHTTGWQIEASKLIALCEAAGLDHDQIRRGLGILDVYECIHVVQCGHSGQTFVSPSSNPDDSEVVNALDVV